MGLLEEHDRGLELAEMGVEQSSKIVGDQLSERRQASISASTSARSASDGLHVCESVDGDGC